jgi:Tol biopolymer transport system component
MRVIVTMLLGTLAACAPGVSAAEGDPSLTDPREVRLRNARQLTFGGENAEAYYSADGTRLIFQSTRDSLACDQIFTMTVEGGEVRLVSGGRGRTTCAFWAPDGQSIIYASTHLALADCPTPPDHSQGYVWAVYGAYDIFRARPDGSDPVRLTSTPGYDAEAVFSHDGRTILFTSARDGDLELYTMRPDGQDVLRLTHRVGYDGGAFFSPGDSLICWRADHPEDSAGQADFKALLSRELIRPTRLELFVMRADGTQARQVTRLGGANFCPYFTPDGTGLIFSSNHHSENGREFDLFLVDLNGEHLQQITFTPEFDGFPMFSPDGQRLVWCSNRNGKVRGETNVFVADWVK